MATKKQSSKKAGTRGPKPEVLKIKGNWETAVSKSFQKKKPAEGWPK
jgi:hypothetical protein